MKFKQAIWIGVICLLLGVSFSFQYKYYNSAYKMEPKQTKLIDELSTLKKEKAALLDKISQLEETLDNIGDKASQESVLVKNLNDELNRYRSYVGLTRLSGPGVIITLDNPDNDSNYSGEKNIVYDYRLILDLVNELYSSGAEAISINEQRMINSSEVRLAGRQINVNMIPLSPPFVIKAIGEYDSLSGGISQRFGIVQSIREAGYYAEVKKAENMEILAYSGIVKFKHARVVK